MSSSIIRLFFVANSVSSEFCCCWLVEVDGFGLGRASPRLLMPTVSEDSLSSMPPNSTYLRKYNETRLMKRKSKLNWEENYLHNVEFTLDFIIVCIKFEFSAKIINFRDLRRHSAHTKQMTLYQNLPVNSVPYPSLQCFSSMTSRHLHWQSSVLLIPEPNARTRW